MMKLCQCATHPVFEYGKPRRGDRLIEMNVDKIEGEPRRGGTNFSNNVGLVSPLWGSGLILKVR